MKRNFFWIALLTGLAAGIWAGNLHTWKQIAPVPFFDRSHLQKEVIG